MRQSDLEHFQRHGWVLIENLLSEAEIEAAYAGLFEIYPTPCQFHAETPDPRAAAFRQAAEGPAGGEAPAFRAQQFIGLQEFPFADQTLNLLPLHPNIIDAAETVLGTKDVRLYQAETFAKYTGVTKYAQPFHVDYTNHVMLPPKSDGRYRQTQMFLYLSDVTPAHGATRIVSRELTRATPLANLTFPGVRVPDEQTAAWEAASVSAVGPKGSLLIYGADVLHRATDMTLPGGGRFFFNLAYRAAGADWVGGNPWPRKGVRNWTPLVERCSVRQLEVLGFPPPGHDYWDAETLKGCAERYPGLDLSPWRAALAQP